MTATITPPAGVPNLARTDPAQRLQDYLAALDFYLSLLDHGVDAIVVGENSGSDLSALRELAVRRGHGLRVEFISFQGLDHSPNRGRGYGEFKLVDHLMAVSTTVESHRSTAIVWKVTGRYIVRNLGKILAQQNSDQVDLYCNLRDRPSPWADMYLLAWSSRGHDEFLHGIYKDFDEETLGSAPEVKFRELVDRARVDSSLRIVPRFRVVPYVVGLRGGDGRPYTRGRGTVKYWARVAASKVARNLWI
ncbi:hypothetical protein [Pseudarthrobacter sp. NPDC058119]|uniref:hypothetical protein n=1 Tax=Pseudarthrobacter sp. NPDC058119 TaxID=3346348 RepID=UPI0036D84A8A